MKIQPLSSNYTNTNFGISAKVKTGRKSSVNMAADITNSSELKQFVSALEDLKTTLVIKLLPYTRKAMETNPKASLLAKKLSDVNSVLYELKPLPQNTLKQKKL